MLEKQRGRFAPASRWPSAAAQIVAYSRAGSCVALPRYDGAGGPTWLGAELAQAAHFKASGGQAIGNSQGLASLPPSGRRCCVWGQIEQPDLAHARQYIGRRIGRRSTLFDERRGGTRPSADRIEADCECATRVTIPCAPNLLFLAERTTIKIEPRIHPGRARPRGEGARRKRAAPRGCGGSQHARCSRSAEYRRHIFEKIANADAFVADVSITDTSAKRPAPNANVLVELGYALHALGESRVILVANRHFGTVDLLPFDLRQLRCLVYDCDPEAADKASVRRPFADTLNTALRAVLAQPSDHRLPDIRVTATRGQLIPGIDEDATPVVTMTVENHSSIPLYLSSLSLQLPAEEGTPRGLWFKNDVRGHPNSGGKIEPGDRYDFYFDEREFPLEEDGEAPLCVEATDKISRRFLSNRAEFAKLLADISKERASTSLKPSPSGITPKS